MNIAAFDLNLLVVFDALLAEGSVTRAAGRVGLSQPAFSNALARLRAAVGEPLFQRTGGGMIPTPRARAMSTPVRSALADLHRALALSSDSPVPSRVVTIAANEYARCLMLPLIFQALSKRTPAITLDVCDAASPAAGHAEFLIDWADEGRTSPRAIILRDHMVGVVASRNRRIDGAAKQAKLGRSQEIVVAGINRRSAAAGRGASQTVPDALTAVCSVSDSDRVAEIPRRLARLFALMVPLKVFSLAHPVPRLALGLSSRAASPADPAAAIVHKCVVDAAKRLGRGRAR